MSVFSAILLAAGESRRMGAINKMTLPVAGKPLLRRTGELLLDLGLVETVVVLGHEQDTARSLLRGLPLRSVFNPHYRDGQMTSVHAGMAALRQPCDGVLVCLADLPLLEVEDLERLMAAFADCTTSVLVPTFQGRRGNPIVLAYEHRQAILAGDRNLGCKRLIEKNPELVSTVEMATDHVVFDLDTEQAYRQLQHRLGEADQIPQASNYR
jgi:molybdenum cofactor cytidylyltransferase